MMRQLHQCLSLLGHDHIEAAGNTSCSSCRACACVAVRPSLHCSVARLLSTERLGQAHVSREAVSDASMTCTCPTLRGEALRASTRNGPLSLLLLLLPSLGQAR